MNPTAHLMSEATRRGEADAAMVEHALLVAATAHHGQLRKSRDPYITHPIAVASIVIEFGASTETVAAALLHDVLIDTSETVEQLRAEFPRSLVELLVEYKKLTRVTEWETDREVTDRRLAQLKTADRLHNMRTIEFVEKDKSHHASRPSPRVGRSGRRVEHPLNLGASSGSRA